jgi:hypothetical protein
MISVSKWLSCVLSLCRNQVHRRKAPKKKEMSPYKPRPATAGKTARRKPLEPSLQHAPYRPQSARFEYGKTVKKNGLVIGMNSSDDEMNMMNNDQKFFYKRSPKPNVPRIRSKYFSWIRDVLSLVAQFNVLDWFRKHGANWNIEILHAEQKVWTICHPRSSILNNVVMLNTTLN